MEITTFKPLFAIGSTDKKNEEDFRKEVLNDYYICCVSREASILARKEVLTGKAKFGITGDGKEVIQVALAKAIRKGDYRAGYYRDQTLMFALGISSLEEYFAQLYADPENDPFSRGRQMMTHFASPLVDEHADFTDHTNQFNNSADVSCTAGQMGRAIGLATASKKYRKLPSLASSGFSRNGNEIVICSIGDGSTSEGAFWETVNASAVTKVPIAFCVWDDGYAISVPTDIQTVKGSISKALEGFLIDEEGRGIRIYTAKAWDYAGLCDMFITGLSKIRETHTPALFHVQDTTQPLGHSTSGSHQRYKPKERLEWEEANDCIVAFANWIVRVGLATKEELAEIKKKGVAYARLCKKEAWRSKTDPIRQVRQNLMGIIKEVSSNGMDLEEYKSRIRKLIDPEKSDLYALGREAAFECVRQGQYPPRQLVDWCDSMQSFLHKTYSTHLYTEAERAIDKVDVINPQYDPDSPIVKGYEVLNKYFDWAFAHNEHLFAFGEDVGKLGDVNQGMAGMQKKYGAKRVFDTGIREWTIIGQAIGMAMRGLRPIAEIQYLDYLVYGMAPLMDDLATLSYRSAGIQKAPALIRTRGHRLEGIWHTGSPMGMLLHSLRGLHILVPRNMVQAVGMYQTWLQGMDPVLMIECLNGYRHKERLPSNLGSYTVPYGVPEILMEGTDLTLVTYGACVRLAEAACQRLRSFGVSVELIDVQTLMPFDLPNTIVQSLKKTNRILFVDEDVPGGASAYMMQQVLEVQGGFDYLEIEPRTLTGKSHRPPYGSDGDYYSKPSIEDIFEAVYHMLHILDPSRYPLL